MTEARDQQIHELYAAFNRRDSSFATSRMAPDVTWPRAFKGGFVEGPEAVGAYWQEQWSEIDPIVVPQRIHPIDGDHVDVEVHQVVRDLSGAVLDESVVHHVYRFTGDLIAGMTIPSST